MPTECRWQSVLLAFYSEFFCCGGLVPAQVHFVYSLGHQTRISRLAIDFADVSTTQQEKPEESEFEA